MRHLLLISALLSTLSSSLVQASDALSRSVAQEVVSNSQTWRSRQNDGDYVIQLVSVRKAMHLPKAEDIRAIKSVNPDLDVVYHPKRVKGATWHTLVWGSFASKAEGKAMFSQLPARWQKMQPWVRPMSSIQGAAPVIITKAKPKAVAKPVVAKPVPRTRPAPKSLAKNTRCHRLIAASFLAKRFNTKMPMRIMHQTCLTTNQPLQHRVPTHT